MTSVSEWEGCGERPCDGFGGLCQEVKTLEGSVHPEAVEETGWGTGFQAWRKHTME